MSCYSNSNYYFDYYFSCYYSNCYFNSYFSCYNFGYCFGFDFDYCFGYYYLKKSHNYFYLSINNPLDILNNSLNKRHISYSIINNLYYKLNKNYHYMYYNFL